SLSSSLCEPDEFLEPRRASRLHMDPGAGFCKRAADGTVDGELVAAGMHAHLQIRWKPVDLDRVCNHREVALELNRELPHIPGVIDTLVESPRELWCDRLNGNLFIRDGCKYHQQFHRSLRVISLIHRNLGDEVGGALV